MSLIINDARMVGHLGKGAFGQVHLAELKPHGLVALKEIPVSAGDWAALEEALSEGERLAAAAHPNVVRVHAVGFDSKCSRAYIATERCDTCLEKLGQAGPVPLGQAYAFVVQALTGLSALHQRDIIHRDLKPANILVRKGVAKLSDFGLATDKMILGYAATNRVYLPHIAPELTATGLSSKKTDVWAMGMTVYRILNGEPHFLEERQRLQLRGMLSGVAVSDPKFSRALRWLPHVPHSWRRFVRKALNHDSGSRYSSGGEMLSAVGGRSLPSDPSWQCVASPTDVVWSREKNGGRREVVEWTRGGATHSCRAYTEPSASAGRAATTLKLRTGSGAAILKDLEAYFDSKNK